MTLWLPRSEPDPPPLHSIEPDQPRRGGEGATGNKVTSALRSAYLEKLRAIAPQRTEAELRRRLVAIGTERRDKLAYGAEHKLHALWTKVADGWRSCGWTCLFRNDVSGTVIGLPNHCDRILCPYDEARRLGRLRDRYRPAAAAAAVERRLFFVVLTMPNVPLGELAPALDMLAKARARLCRRQFWIGAIAGGFWRFELTFNLEQLTWHPHLNLLIESSGPLRMADFQPALQAQWRAVLARLGVKWRNAAGELSGQWVWLEEAGQKGLVEAIKQQMAEGKSPAEAAQAAAAMAVDRGIDYAVKPDPDWSDPAHPEWVIEYVEAMAARRSLNSFGSWRGLLKPKSEPVEELVKAPYVPGEFFADRMLPYLDPVTDQPATWSFSSFGPRHLLRPLRPPGEHRQEWLVWHPSIDDLDPAIEIDDLSISYQPSLGMPP